MKGEAPKSEVRTMSEIIKGVNKDSYNSITKAWNEMVANKYQYPIVQLEFAREHFEDMKYELEKEFQKILSNF